MAGSTPVFGFPYPQPSDLVANYPALGQDLAEDVETAILAAGKIKQVVRSTDGTNRTTTSTSFVDASLSVTIVPQAGSSNILLIWSGCGSSPAASQYLILQITDSANTALSGAQSAPYGGNNTQMEAPLQLFAWVAAVNTSSRTYKIRFRVNAGTGSLNNTNSTGQLFAIEVAP